MFVTTLNDIREHAPCREGWTKLLGNLGKTKADDAPLMLLSILESNGFMDALWCLRAVKGRDREIRLFSVWCARRVEHLMEDKRSIKALHVAERFANGDATQGELDVAGAAAGAAARDAAWAAAEAAARAAEWAAARDYAAWDAAWYAAWAAARDAAEAAARAAEWAAARDAAWAAERKEQEVELRRMLSEGYPSKKT